MKPRDVVIMALAVFASRCTHIRQVHSFDDINKAAAGKLASMTLTNGQVLSGKGLQMAMDSTFWLDKATGRKQSIATSEIGKVVIKKRGRGALEGLGIGILTGAVTGALIGFASGDDDPKTVFLPLTAEEKALGGGIVLGGAGGLLGLPIGAAVGSKDKFVLHEKKSADK